MKPNQSLIDFAREYFLQWPESKYKSINKPGLDEAVSKYIGHKNWFERETGKPFELQFCEEDDDFETVVVDTISLDWHLNEV